MTEGEGPFLVDTGNGLTIRYHGRNLYSPTAPAAAAQKRASSIELSPQTLVFVPSPLLFYGIEDLIESLEQEVHFLCVEVDQHLMRLSLENVAPALLQHERLSFIRTDSVDEVLKALHRAGIHHFRRTAHLLVNGGSSMNRALYSQMYRAVEHEIQNHWRNRMTLMHMSHLWIKNFFQNLGAAAVGGDVQHMKTSLPVVVAGAGESLEDAAPALVRMRDRYLLLAVDTAAGSLDALGLRPDGVVVLDAQSANLKDLVGFDTEGISLLADVTAYPECVRRFSEEKWFFFSDFARLQLFDRARAAGLMPTAVPPLGSVGITALYCALSITEGPVLFTGLDFAFVPGKSHARGAPAHVDRLQKSDRLSPADALDAALERPHLVVEGKAGMRLWTDSTLLGYSNSLDIFVEGKHRVYDLGRTGLRNSAAPVTDAAELEQLLSAGPAPHAGTGTNRGRSTETRQRERYSAAGAFLRNERQRIDEVVREAVDALGRGTTPETAPDGLREGVRELDYVYLHFPDWSAEPILTEGFLKRFVEAAETRASWIDRALAQLP